MLTCVNVTIHFMQHGALTAIDPQVFVDIPAVTPIGSEQPVSETLPLAVQRIVEHLSPHKIILFGSYAYGHPTPDSDVDLLVVMETDETNTTRRYMTVSRLLAPRLFPADILVQTPMGLAQALDRANCFYREVVSLGKVLYEQR